MFTPHSFLPPLQEDALQERCRESDGQGRGHELGLLMVPASSHSNIVTQILSSDISLSYELFQSFYKI